MTLPLRTFKGKGRGPRCSGMPREIHLKILESNWKNAAHPTDFQQKLSLPFLKAALSTKSIWTASQFQGPKSVESSVEKTDKFLGSDFSILTRKWAWSGQNSYSSVSSGTCQTRRDIPIRMHPARISKL